MIRAIRMYFRRDEGASAVEYGLLVAGIAVVIIAAVFTLGGSVRDVFERTSGCIEAAPADCPAPAPAP